MAEQRRQPRPAIRDTLEARLRRALPRGESGDETPERRLRHRAIDGKFVQHPSKLGASHEASVALAPVQEATRAVTEQVVAHKPSDGPQHPRSLGQGLLPLQDVVQHDEREHGVKRAVRKRQRGCIRLAHLRSGPKLRQPPLGDLHHRLVVIGGGETHIGRPAQHLSRHRSAAAPDLEDIAPQLEALQRPRQDDATGEDAPRGAPAHELRDTRHLGHSQPPVRMLRSVTVATRPVSPTVPHGRRAAGVSAVAYRRASSATSANDCVVAPWTSSRVVAVGLGGALGAGVRWAVLTSKGEGGLFPWPLLAVNIAGSILLGVLLAEEWTHPRARLLLHDAGAIGFCGGMTTFSTFAVEVAALLDDDHLRMAVAYAAASIVGTLAGVVAGAAGLRQVRALTLPVEEEL